MARRGEHVEIELLVVRAVERTHGRLAGPASRADLAIVKAWKGDAEGDLVFRKTARNFNPMMATAGKACVVEVEEIVPVGSIDPDQIHFEFHKGTRWAKTIAIDVTPC